MSFSIIENLSPSIKNEFDDLFKDKDGIIKPVDAVHISKFKQSELSAYCHQNAMYGIITVELVEIIKSLIKGFKSIEIGSGNGTLGRSLNIPMFDNYMQNLPEILLMYSLSLQPTIKYGHDVIKMDALDAIKKYKPDIVIGSWITHKYDPIKFEMGGNILGVDEVKMFDLGVKQYIMFGNEITHHCKPLFNDTNYNVTRLESGAFYSRSLSKEYNRLYIIEKQKNANF